MEANYTVKRTQVGTPAETISVQGAGMQAPEAFKKKINSKPVWQVNCPQKIEYDASGAPTVIREHVRTASEEIAALLDVIQNKVLSNGRDGGYKSFTIGENQEIAYDPLEKACGPALTPPATPQSARPPARPNARN